ncbi:TIGR00730 family Rossman fold protein [Rhodovibrio sodomensis]|uniref:Cytokinin riboside 5'-monophosphate phosphoribohydrolase n=1 Tax=Rhodovibrio sodomensis TaxID=1088 RepID=A0ABS1DKM0_9PROT|nr:TIGR00730 family Rossman fold protein [Rhodovibrio sodomensis]MBK1671070.1 TIGR00730 family Rossman fold protein [Rhodovibrio sodomensis]
MAKLDTLCVYCGSSAGAAQGYGAIAQELGRRCAEQGVGVVYGGGTVGLMGQVADAAVRAGGTVTGIIPRHLMSREVGEQADSELVVVDNMHQRKQAMFERADAFCSLPGGIGTLDETIEILTWKQLGLHDKPVVLIDHDGFWRPLFDLFAHQQAMGFLKPDHIELFEVVSDIDGLFRAIEEHPDPTRPDRPEWT